MNRQQYNAHLIAKHLKAITAILRQEDPLDKKALRHFAFKPSEIARMLEKDARCLEDSATFELLTDIDKGLVSHFIAEMTADQSTHERLVEITSSWTEADWRAEYETLQIMLKEDNG